MAQERQLGQVPQPSRRRLLGLVAAGGLGALGGGAGVAWLLSGASKTDAAGENRSRTQSGGGRAPLPDRAGAAPSPDQKDPVQMVDRGGVKTVGIPDSASNVELARGSFKSSLGQGMEAFAAEPGFLWVGPDFESKSKNNPWGDNPNGWQTMWDSKGHIRPFSPDSQHSFVTDPPASYLASEGGWAVFSAPQLSFEIAGTDMKVEAPAEKGRNYLIVVRGLYPDGKQDSPRNTIVRLTDYQPAATLGMRHPGGSEAENSAFWSEGQAKQMVATSHRSDSNCGLEGCSRVTIVYLDLNTRAFGVWEHSAGRGANLQEAIANAGKGWTAKFKNY